MAKNKTGDSSSELLQIIILTLAMTGGGFCLLYMGLSFWLLPKVERNVQSESRSYKALAELLQSPEMVELRANARDQEESAEAKTLGVIIDEQLRGQSLATKSRNPTEKDTGRIIEKKLLLQLEAAPMQQIIDFVTLVRHSKKSVRIESFDLSRKSARRGSDATDEWSAKVDIVEFKPKT